MSGKPTATVRPGAAAQPSATVCIDPAVGSTTTSRTSTPSTGPAASRSPRSVFSARRNRRTSRIPASRYWRIR